MIREYKPEDLDQVMDIWYQSSTLAHDFLEDDFVQIVKKAMYDIYIPKSKTWVYIKDEKPIGFISMADNEIGGLFLYPKHFGNGIGAKLVNHIVDLYKYVEVEVFENNTIGRSFYNKYGFKFLSKYYHKESKQEVLRLCYTKK